MSYHLVHEPCLGIGGPLPPVAGLHVGHDARDCEERMTESLVDSEEGRLRSRNGMSVAGIDVEHFQV